jgi:hypothetical protein
MDDNIMFQAIPMVLLGYSFRNIRKANAGLKFRDLHGDEYSELGLLGCEICDREATCSRAVGIHPQDMTSQSRRPQFVTKWNCSVTICCAD